MGLTRKKQIERAKEVGLSYANTFYNDFIEHPEWKGKNFKWSNLPSLVERMARAGVYMNFPHNIKSDIKEIAAKTAFERAKELIKNLEGSE